MLHKLRILIAEDLLSDIELAKREINNSGFECECSVVQTESDFLDALKTFNPELILSAYSMSRFDGMLALNLTKKFDPSLPFIIITRSTNEETVVECMKAGADDYVIKEHISRLGPAIKSVLKKKKNEKDREIFKEALFESERKFRNLFEHSPIGISMTGLDGSLISNKAYCEIVGYSQNELNTKRWQDIAHPDDLQMISQKLQALLKKEVDYIRYERRYIHKNGDTIWVDGSICLQLNKDGKPQFFIVSAIDISDRKRTEDKLNTLNNAIEQSPVTIVITKPDGSIEYVNPKFYEITGYSSQEVIGKNPRILQSGDKPKQEYEELWNIILSGNTWQGEFHNKKKNGELYWEDAIISPILDNKGNITHFVGIKDDITEKKKMMGDLIAAKDKAEEMSRLKSSLLNNMSHELRTPLIGILGFAEILESEIEDPDLLNMIHQIHKGGKRLSETLNLILDLSKIQSEKLTVEYKIFNLADVTKQRIAIYEGAAKVKGLALTTIIKDENIFVNTDEKIFSQILDNLVNNAIKFTNTGGIKVILDKQIVSGNGLQESYAILKVADTGIGISEENFELIFEEYRQVSEGLNRTFQGSGLGLNITKKFVEKLGGKVTVESKLGKGSTFTVALPSVIMHPEMSLADNVNANTPESLSQFQETQLKNLPKFLLVDDDTDTYLVTKIFLKNICILDHSTTGLEAIDAVKKNLYNIILMDINLGYGMDGLSALKEIRKVPGYQKIPVVAFTAYAMKKDKEYFINDGCDYYLSKPFEKNDLLNMVSGILDNSSA
ncbi:MAG: PAS domain S-box protein [Ignavibacteriaceae bacterium]|nr:PAS domain S-box protein [Ignavibacteriaceae bacterium]